MYFDSLTPNTIPKLEIPESPDLYHNQNKENGFFNSPPLYPPSTVLNLLETSGSFQFCQSFVVSDASFNELDNAILISDETPPGSVLPTLHEVSTSSVSPIGGNTTVMKVSVLEEGFPQEDSFPEPTPQPVPLPPTRFDYKDSPVWSPGVGVLVAESSEVTHRTRGSLANLFSQTSPQQPDHVNIFKSLQHQRSASVPLPALLHREEPAHAPVVTARSFIARPQRVTSRPKPLSTDELILMAGIEARKKLHARVEKGLRVAAKFRLEVSQRSTPQTQQSRMLTLPRGPNLRTAKRAEVRRNRTMIAN